VSHVHVISRKAVGGVGCSICGDAPGAEKKILIETWDGKALAICRDCSASIARGYASEKPWFWCESEESLCTERTCTSYRIEGREGREVFLCAKHAPKRSGGA
jgi:hypothetical protein